MLSFAMKLALGKGVRLTAAFESEAIHGEAQDPCPKRATPMVRGVQSPGCIECLASHPKVLTWRQSSVHHNGGTYDEESWLLGMGLRAITFFHVNLVKFN